MCDRQREREGMTYSKRLGLELKRRPLQSGLDLWYVLYELSYQCTF